MATVGVRTTATPGLSSGLGLANALTKALVPDPTRQASIALQAQRLQQQSEYQQQLLDFQRQKEANDQQLVPLQAQNYESEIASRAGNLDIARQKVGPEIAQSNASAASSNASAAKTNLEADRLRAQNTALSDYASALGDQRVAALGPVPVHVVQPQSSFPMSADTEGGFAAPVPVDVGWDKTQKYNVDSRAARSGAAAIVQLAQNSADLAKGVGESAPQPQGQGGLQFKGNELKQQALNYILSVNKNGGPDQNDPNAVAEYNLAMSTAFPGTDVTHAGQNGAIGVMHVPGAVPAGIAPPVQGAQPDKPAFTEVVPGQRQLSASQQQDLPRLQEMGNAQKYLDKVQQGDIPSRIQHMAGNPAANQFVSSVGSLITSGDTKTYEDKSLQFISGIMRKETGAAIKDEEFPMFYARFIPTAGDGPEQIQVKAAARAAVMKGMVEGQFSAVPKAAEIDRFLRENGMEGLNLEFRDTAVPPSARQGAPAGPVEGQTATNRQTGEKLIYRGGKWGPM